MEVRKNTVWDTTRNKKYSKFQKRIMPRNQKTEEINKQKEQTVVYYIIQSIIKRVQRIGIK
jgi:hypothetical protein